MRIFFKVHQQAAMILVITLLAFILRFHHYAQFPSHDATADEKAWSWLGASLLTEGQPTSWSLFKSYRDDYIFNQTSLEAPLVRPVLDHPPLFGLIPGFFHLLSGLGVYDLPSQTAIRFPMVLIGTLNVFLFACLAFRLTDIKSALIGSLLFASSPLVVASSRLVVADNLLATLVLVVSLHFVYKKQHLSWLMIISALAILLKVQGVFIGAGITLYYFIEKKYSSAMMIFGSMLLALGLFALYGAFYNWDLFRAILAEQSSRAIGLATLIHRFFFYPSLAAHLWPTGEKSMFFVVTMVVIVTKQREKFYHLLGSMVIAFLVVALAAFDETNINGWYEYALFPIFFLCFLSVVEYMFKKANQLALWLLWLLFLLPLVKMWAVNLGQLEPFSPLTRKLLPLAGAVFVLPWSDKMKKAANWGFFIVLISLQAAVVWTLSNQSYNHQLYLLGRY